MSDYELNIVLFTDRNLGDHGEMLRIAVKPDPDETVAQLVERVRDQHGKFGGGTSRHLAAGDVIEIRWVSGG